MFGKGISKEGDVLDLASNLDSIQKPGAWYAYQGDKIGQGRENAKAYLAEHPDVMEDVTKLIRAHYGLDADDSDASASGSSSDVSVEKEEKA